MTIEEIPEYYSDRQRASMAMSQAASEPGIRRIHLELARRYADLAGDARDGIEPVTATLDEFKEPS